MRKLFSVFYYMISSLILAWFALSWFEIVIKSGTPDPQYMVLNVFKVMCEIA